MKATKKPFDFWIFMSVLILLALGIIMVFSASMPTASSKYQDPYYFLKKQLLSALIGFVAMFLAANFDYRKIGKYAPVLLIVSIVLLVAVLIVGEEIKGTRRWIGTGSFQPSEFAKLAVILFFSYSLSKGGKERLQYFFKGFLPYLMVMGVYAVLLLLEPHLSCTIIVLSVASIIMFSAGAKVKHFMYFVVPAIAGLSVLVAFVPYMRDRVLSFTNPFAYASNEGYQAVQSLYAIGSGGLFGRGLGKSLQKFLYIPEPHNDFIFAVLAEELGYIGVLAVLTLFLIFIWRGIKVSMYAPDVFGSLVAVGITSLIAVQSLLNVAVVTSSIPPTGVSLPFFSYGGTSLVLFMFEVGILLNISRYASYDRI